MDVDLKLIEACKANDRVAQKQLYSLSLPYLASVCRRYLRSQSDINDALQESFIQLYRGLGGYDPTRAAFKTWAVRVTINATLKLNERLHKVDVIEFDTAQHDTGTAPEIYSSLSDDDMMAFLQKMPKDFFQVFNLHVVDGFSHQEIAALLDIDIALSRQRLSRARKWISERTDAQESSEDSREYFNSIRS